MFGHFSTLYVKELILGKIWLYVTNLTESVFKTLLQDFIHDHEGYEAVFQIVLPLSMDCNSR